MFRKSLKNSPTTGNKRKSTENSHNNSNNENNNNNHKATILTSHSSSKLSNYPEFSYPTKLTPFSYYINNDAKELLGKQEVRRQDRIAEFIFFERNHLRRLRIMSVIFYDRIRTHLPIVEFDEKMPAVEKLISLHSELAKLFDQHYSEPSNAIYDFGSVLEVWINYNGFFEVFIEACKTFCKKQLSAGLWIQEQMKINEQLHYELKQAEEEEIVGKLPFQNYLAAQMQHLTKYPMLVEGVLKLTPESSEEYEILARVKKRFVQILQDVNQSVKIAQDQDKHEEIASNLDISMLKGYSQIIGISIQELSYELTPQKLIHYGVLKFNNKNHDCLLFEKFFVMTTVRSTRREYILKVETVKTEVFNETGSMESISETIYPVMRIDDNFGIDGNEENQFEFTEIKSLFKKTFIETSF